VTHSPVLIRLNSFLSALVILLLVPLPVKYLSWNWIFFKRNPSTQISVSSMRKFLPESSTDGGTTSLKMASFIIGIGQISKLVGELTLAELPAPSYMVIRTFPFAVPISAGTSQV